MDVHFHFLPHICEPIGMTNVPREGDCMFAQLNSCTVETLSRSLCGKPLVTLLNEALYSWTRVVVGFFSFLEF